MNIHHLELFFYVAKFEGISNAVRRIPYGIQQPAVSRQISQLEENLETILFKRRPFMLTEAGEKLYDFVAPFFDGLDNMAHELRGGASHRLRVGAAHLILGDHVPVLMERIHQQNPNFKLSLRHGHQPELEAALLSHEIDLAITVLEKKPLPGIEAKSLLEVPMVLVVKRASKVKSVEDLFREGRILEPLISMPPNEPTSRMFQQGLIDTGVDWHPSIEVNSFELVEKFVAAGYGIGLGVLSPTSKRQPGLRALELHGFPTLKIGVLWRGKPEGLLKSFIQALDDHAASLKKEVQQNGSGTRIQPKE